MSNLHRRRSFVGGKANAVNHVVMADWQHAAHFFVQHVIGSLQFRQVFAGLGFVELIGTLLLAKQQGSRALKVSCQFAAERIGVFFQNGRFDVLIKRINPRFRKRAPADKEPPRCRGNDDQNYENAEFFHGAFGVRRCI